MEIDLDAGWFCLFFYKSRQQNTRENVREEAQEGDKGKMKYQGNSTTLQVHV